MPSNVASDGTLVSPKPPVAPAPAPLPIGAPGLPSPGDVLLAKIRVGRLIGEGGMAYVYAAQHEILDLPVALKILSPEVVDDETLTRFFHEAKIATRIRNVHVCGVLDAGLLDDGAPYMLMELLEGMNLEELLAQRGPLPIDVAVDYVLQALEGLAHAHAVGVVHRDLKPNNLFLSLSARRTPTIKVIDFGISKSRMLSGLSRVGTIIGSPTYMAPEQLERPSEIDARTDLWAIGVVLYELLTGKTPFDADTIEVLAARIVNESPTPIRHHRAEIPRALELVIWKCLSKAKEDRHADALALASVLAPFAKCAPFERLARMRAVRAEGMPAPRESGMRSRVRPPAATISPDDTAPMTPISTRPSSGTLVIAAPPSPSPSPSPSSSSSSSPESKKGLSQFLPLAAAAIIVCAFSMVAGAGLSSLRHAKVEARSASKAPCEPVPVPPVTPR